MDKELAYYRGRLGIWIVYINDNGPQVQYYTNNVVKAVENQADGYRICFWPLGKELRESIALWDSGINEDALSAGENRSEAQTSH